MQLADSLAGGDEEGRDAPAWRHPTCGRSQPVSRDECSTPGGRLLDGDAESGERLDLAVIVGHEAR